MCDYIGLKNVALINRLFIAIRLVFHALFEGVLHRYIKVKVFLDSHNLQVPAYKGDEVCHTGALLLL